MTPLSAPCLLDLVQEGERRLGCHPRRRRRVLAQRIADCEQTVTALQVGLTQMDPRWVAQLERCTRLSDQIQAAEAHMQQLSDQPVSARQSGTLRVNLTGCASRSSAGIVNWGTLSSGWLTSMRSCSISGNASSKSCCCSRTFCEACGSATPGSAWKMPGKPPRHGASCAPMPVLPRART